MPLPTTYTENDRFHSFKQDYAQRSFDRALKRGELSQSDVSLINAYIRERSVINHVSSKRVLKMVSNLITVRRFLGCQFRDADIAQVYNAVGEIDNGISTKGKSFSQNTRADLIQIFKSLLLWMIDSELTSLPEKKVRLIRIPKKISTKTAADLIGSDDVTAMMEMCDNSMDRAILITMYEGGFRVGEIGEMKWGDLVFDGTGVIATVRFKTEKTRYVRLVMAKEHLTKWKSDYPDEITDNALVFLTTKHAPITYSTIATRVSRLAKRAGITKHITPHIFRHSRITHLIQQRVSDSVIKMMMWGSVESEMFKNYVHLTGGDIDREIYNLYGIEPQVAQVTGKDLKPKICPHCHEMNSPISHYCHLCSHPLDNASLEDADAIQRYLIEHPDFIRGYLNHRDLIKESRGVDHSV